MSIVFERERVGFFDRPGDEPAFDPGLAVNCPGCEKPLKDRPVRTISIMAIDGSRSYFYRIHQTCDSAWLREVVENAILIEMVGV